MKASDQEIDDEIFSGSDTPSEKKYEIFSSFKEEIEDFIRGGFSGDKAFLPELEVLVAMLGVLSRNYFNPTINFEDVERWKRETLRFFDQETVGQEAETAKWRRNLELNFGRLEDSVKYWRKN